MGGGGGATPPPRGLSAIPPCGAPLRPAAHAPPRAPHGAAHAGGGGRGAGLRDLRPQRADPLLFVDHLLPQCLDLFFELLHVPRRVCGAEGAQALRSATPPPPHTHKSRGVEWDSEIAIAHFCGGAQGLSCWGVGA